MITYEELLRETQPEVISTQEQYDEVSERLGAYVRKGKLRSVNETKMMRLLAVLVQEYDQRHRLPPSKLEPYEALQYLLESSGKSSADLQAVFGQRSHVSEALRGKRRISAEQARKLGDLFHVNPGLFI